MNSVASPKIFSIPVAGYTLYIPAHAQWLRFGMHDTGISIRRKKHKAMFDAFSGRWVTRRYGGTGLGLTISRLVEIMVAGYGWRVFRDCITFHFTVPLGAARAGKQQSAPESDLRGRGVLVVDDNSTNLRILEEILNSSGMRPTLASDARTARSLELELDAGRRFRCLCWMRTRSRQFHACGTDPERLTAGQCRVNDAEFGETGGRYGTMPAISGRAYTKPIGQGELKSRQFAH